MGYYIETGMSRNKALSLVVDHGATVIDQPQSFSEIPPDKALICVVHNPMFEAAALCYDQREFDEFTRPDERRHREYVLLDRELAHKLAGYKRG